MKRFKKKLINQSFEWKPHVRTRTMSAHFNAGGGQSLRLKRLRMISNIPIVKKKGIRTSLIKTNQTGFGGYTEVAYPGVLQLANPLIII